MISGLRPRYRILFVVLFDIERHHRDGKHASDRDGTLNDAVHPSSHLPMISGDSSAGLATLDAALDAIDATRAHDAITFFLS